ncbi:MAG: class I SAM-dependent methyltransferase [Chloroflexi bacterium]|nr:class I SAM-dependent methyltransferase [Chloroflexota bacterium]
MSDLRPDGSFDTASDPSRPSVADLLAAWARRVRANREQVERFGEQQDGPDRYARVAGRFRADPRRTDDPSLDLLLELARPDDVWLDVGAGGGRYALPLALRVREVIAVDPSDGMLGVLREGMAEHGVDNVRIVQGRWPAVAEDPAVRADVTMISQVGYDVEEIGPFVDALERSARRECLSLMLWRRPTSSFDRLWPEVHGVERAHLPGLREFLSLLMARGRPPSVTMLAVPPQSYESVEQAHQMARHQTWVQPGSEKDRRLERTLRERLVERDGRLAFSWEPWLLGLVRWSPGPAVMDT